jgi:hypothetical protein
MKRLFAAAGIAAATSAALLGAAHAQADPYGPGPGMCQFLGTYHNVWHRCDEPYYPDAGNPPYGSPLPPWQCQGINAHNVGCS